MWIALVVIEILAFPVASATERETVCVRYQKESGWSSGYKVQATVLSGVELNQATKSLRYNALAKYVVVFWDRGEASVLELGFVLRI